MKNNILKGIVILGIIILIFWLGRCTKECEVETVRTTITIPEKKGSFESPKVLVPESNTIKTVIEYRDSILVIPQVNEELIQKYLALQQENDVTKRENEQLKLYTDAISINTYKNNFNNEDIDLTITSKVQGKLLEVKPEYTIKSKTITQDIQVPKDKQKVLSFNIGAYTTYNKELKQFDPGIKLDIVGKKGAVLSAGYSIDKNIMVGYSIPIFSIKK
jgi:hypothetical protein